MIKTLGKTSWDKIEIGEIFAYEGCWCVFEKTTEKYATLLAADNNELQEDSINSTYNFGDALNYCGIKRVTAFDCMYSCKQTKESIYKLPKSVQALWRTD